VENHINTPTKRDNETAIFYAIRFLKDKDIKISIVKFL